MKKFKTALAAVLAACALLNLTGCSENNGAASGLPGDNVNSANNADGSDNSVSSDDKGESRVDSSDPGKSDASAPNANDPNTSSSRNSAETIKTQYAPITLTDSNTENSIRLFDAITADKTNAMFSPLSLNMALGLLEAGADGETKAQIDSYLQTENYTDFAFEYLRFVKAYRMITGEKEPWGDTPAAALEIANSFWADNALPLKDDYKQRIGGRFGAEIRNLDFADAANALKEINSWVNKKTHEMIPSVLEDISPDTAAVLVNTVYFEANWLDEWNIDENKKESFTLSDGTVKELSLMYNGADSYFENSYATAFGCRYRNGVEFIGILPKESGEFTLESLDIPALLKSETTEYDVSAVMPRLKFDTDFTLRDALCAAGLENVFDGSAADFSGISDMPLCVSEIIQKTSLELDENGTKASAATAVIMAGGAPVYKGTKTVRLDRPFAFMIYDSVKDQILFMGKVTEIDG